MSNKPSSTGHRPKRDLGKENFWRSTLKAHAASGQDIRSYCRIHGLTESSFHFWRQCLARRDREKKAPRPTTNHRPAFVELRPQLIPACPVETPLELRVGDRRLLIRSDCDRTLLRDLLVLLEA